MINKENPYIQATLNHLILNNIIPSSSTFDITEELLGLYLETYDKLKQSTGPISNSRKTKTKNRISSNFARKLAGLSLIKLKVERGATAASCKEGFVYLISNPAWPEHYKVGMTLDVYKRLSAYQTYSPYRDYKIDFYEFVHDRRAFERFLLNKFKLNIELGEWVKHSSGLDIINSARKLIIPVEPSW